MDDSTGQKPSRPRHRSSKRSFRVPPPNCPPPGRPPTPELPPDDVVRDAITRAMLYVQSRAPNLVDADGPGDIVNKAMLAYLEGRRRWPVCVPFSVWLINACRSLLSAARRSYAARNGESLDVSPHLESRYVSSRDGVLQELLAKDCLDRLYAALPSARDRRLLEATIDGISSAALAAEFGSSEATIKRLRAKLRARLVDVLRDIHDASAATGGPNSHA